MSDQAIFTASFFAGVSAGMLIALAAWFYQEKKKRK